MKHEKAINYKGGRAVGAKSVFLICALVLIYCPFF